MESVDFSINLQNLKGIPFEKYDMDFTFVVDGRRYPTPRIIADILSPKIRKFHFVDESITEFHFTTNNQNNYFPDFLRDLFFHDEHLLDSIHIAEYSTYFKKLGNIDESLKLEEMYFSKLTTENAISRLQNIYKLYEENSEEFDRHEENTQKVISFIATHFDEFLEEGSMNKLDREIIDSILSSKELKISDENSLFEFILNLYEADSSYSHLFSRVLFCNLSSESIKKFFTTFSIDDIDTEIWHSLCALVFTSQKKNKKERHFENLCKEFKAESGHEFDGICNYLIKKTGGNIHDNKTIKVTSNSIYANHHPRNLLDYKKKNFYNSLNESDISILFDFKDKQIQLSDYAIKSHSRGQNQGNMRNWVVEVSNNCKTWTEVDRHTNDSILNSSDAVGVFRVKEVSDFYRYVRIRQTGLSWAGHPENDWHTIYFCCIEFFGKLKEES